MNPAQKSKKIIKNSADNFNDYLINIINSIADPIFVKDNNYRFVVVNDALCNMLGMSRKDIIGKTLGESLPKDQMKHFLEVDKKVLESGQDNTSEEKLTGKDNKILTIVTKKTRYVDSKGNKFLVGVIRDITERKNLETQFQKEKLERQIILDSIPAWIFYKDAENRFISVNKAFADVMGISKEKMEGKSLFDLFPKEQAENFMKDDKEVIDSGKPKVNIIESMKSPKDLLWVQTDKIPYRDEKGNIVGIIGFTIDITERKQIEEKFKEKIDEMEKMNRLMVGRELKMIELKERIKELENQPLTVAGPEKSWTEKFQEGVDLEESVIAQLKDTYITEIGKSGLLDPLKKEAADLIKILVDDSQKHENLLKGLIVNEK